MFSVAQKREIADVLQKHLRSLGHPELPDDEVSFDLHIEGKESWSWADIRNNGEVPNPNVNPFNEMQSNRTGYPE